MMLISHYNYWIVVILMLIGFYIVIAHENLVKKLIGLSIFQTAVFFFYISVGKITGGTAPILDEKYQLYSNPLPHVLILTAIVVGIATTALGLALVVRIQEAYGSIEENEIQAQDAQDQMECQLEAYGFQKDHILSIKSFEE
jgi:multicomponent Na+:H+ antiporter subunit C